MPIPPLESDALRHRMAIKQQADAILQDGILQVLARVGVSADWLIRIEPDGSMVAVAPDDKAS